MRIGIPIMRSKGGEFCSHKIHATISDNDVLIDDIDLSADFSLILETKDFYPRSAKWLMGAWLSESDTDFYLFENYARCYTLELFQNTEPIVTTHSYVTRGNKVILYSDYIDNTESILERQQDSLLVADGKVFRKILNAPIIMIKDKNGALHNLSRKKHSKSSRIIEKKDDDISLMDKELIPYNHPTKEMLYGHWVSEDGDGNKEEYVFTSTGVKHLELVDGLSFSEPLEYDLRRYEEELWTMEAKKEKYIGIDLICLWDSDDYGRGYFIMDESKQILEDFYFDDSNDERRRFIKVKE